MGKKSIHKKSTRLIEGASFAGGLLSGIFILCMALLVFMEVGLRYVFNRPTDFVLDVVSMLILASVFSGAAYALLVEGHVRVDLVVLRLRESTQRVLLAITYVLILLFTAVFAWKGFQITWTSIKHDWRCDSIVFNYPLWPLFLLIGVGMLLFSIQAVSKIDHSLSSILAHRKDKAQAIKETTKRGTG